MRFKWGLNDYRVLTPAQDSDLYSHKSGFKFGILTLRAVGSVTTQQAQGFQSCIQRGLFIFFFINVYLYDSDVGGGFFLSCIIPNC
jgi:hypothetical protein